MPALMDKRTHHHANVANLARCLSCRTRLDGREECPDCSRAYPVETGLFHAIGPLTGRNRIAATFYDSPSWSRFQFWEQVFLSVQGPGVGAARRQVLRYLPSLEKARVLEVGIGDGQNVTYLPPGWEVFGVDLARNRLRSCLGRLPRMAGRLAWAEAEDLPFEDETFDAVFTVGGINYFRDPRAALQEMRRVARPGAILLAADERPDLYGFGIGHLLGIEWLDRAWLRLTGLDPSFVAMVLDTTPSVESSARVVWPGHRRIPIWNRLGYCLLDTR